MFCSFTFQTLGSFLLFQTFQEQAEVPDPTRGLPAAHQPGRGGYPEHLELVQLRRRRLPQPSLSGHQGHQQ